MSLRFDKPRLGLRADKRFIYWEDKHAAPDDSDFRRKSSVKLSIRTPRLNLIGLAQGMLEAGPMKDAYDQGYRLYFAYGSDMDQEQILQRCPSAKLVCTARLSDHCLGFFGHLSRWDSGEEVVLPCPGANVWGVVYRHDLCEAEQLDAWHDVRLDGTGKQFHFPCSVLDESDHPLPVLLYKRSHNGKPTLPSQEYLHFLTAAAETRGLPKSYIQHLESLPSKKSAYPVPRAHRFLPRVFADPCAACELAHGEDA